jgi:ERF superfamily protein
MDQSELAQIYTQLSDLSVQINSLKKCENDQYSDHRSYEIKDLVTALSKAQGEMEGAEGDGTSHFRSKYASFPAIVKSIRVPLKNNSLSFTQQTIDINGRTLLKTTLWHNSGQWISSTMHVNPSKIDPQELGKYITYLKRYCLSALLGIIMGEEDDDGHSATVAQKQQTYKQPIEEKKQQPVAKKEIIDIPAKTYVTPEQLEMLENELEGFPELCKQVLNGWKLESLSQVERSKFMVGINRIRELKELTKK